MVTILENISPVFVVIALGFLSRRLGFLPDSFISSANRLVYFVAIPILVYSEISKGSFSQSFNGVQIGVTFTAVAMVACVVLLLAKIMKVSPEGTATFAQSSFHSNLGYVGLAVVFYSLGTEGRAAASVLAGFLILFQNFLSIGIYTFTASGARGMMDSQKVHHSAHTDQVGAGVGVEPGGFTPSGGGGKPYTASQNGFNKPFVRLSKTNLKLMGKFLGNPIILATLLGLVSSAAEFRFPSFVHRSFDIVSHMALPLALLIIGGSLKAAPAKRIQMVAISTAFKLLILPLTGLLLFRAVGLDAVPTLIGVILISSPSATLSYVMASEMGGKPDLAAAAVTVSTVLSLFSYTFWIAVVG
jgi:predicted permease